MSETQTDQNYTAHSDLKQPLNLLSLSSVKDALANLKRESNNRYTALFAFEDRQLRNVYYYDAEHPEHFDPNSTLALMPVEESYCVFVQQSQRTFIIHDSHQDPRVSQHAKQPIFRSYCGVPIFTPAGQLWGTICYFDPNPNRITLEQIASLEQAGKLLMQAFTETK